MNSLQFSAHLLVSRRESIIKTRQFMIFYCWWVDKIEDAILTFHVFHFPFNLRGTFEHVSESRFAKQLISMPPNRFAKLLHVDTLVICSHRRSVRSTICKQSMIILHVCRETMMILRQWKLEEMLIHA